VGVARLLALSSSLLVASPAASSENERFVSAARELIGVEYDLGGRLQPGRGVDCQGVLFYAAERTGPCGWKSYSVMPTRSVPRGELGAAVDGLAPVATSALDLRLLRTGDVLWFVGPANNPAEPAIAELDGVKVWVWHTAVYAGDGRFIVGDHFAGAVVEEELLPYLREHADEYAGLLVTRMTRGPTPARCRRHAPMRSPAGR
jgi:cell wall-associated NlpC family hydrolase